MSHTDLTWEGDDYDQGRHSHARLAMIMSHTYRPGSVLDLGANVGYFSHGMGREGYAVTAVEPPNGKEFDLRLIRREHRAWVHEPADLPVGTFDYTLALSVLHHMPQWKAVLDHLIVHTKRALFVEVPSPTEGHPKWHGSRESYAMLWDMPNAKIIGAYPEVTGRVYRDLWKVDVA